MKVMKGVFVVLDGVADEPCRALGDATPLQAAKTPNLDQLAKRSRIEHTHPVKDSVAAQSCNAVMSMMGYDPHLVSRGSLEALGSDIKLTRGDLAIFTNFATIDDLKSGEILDSRAGRTLTSKEARSLGRAINHGVKLPFKFEFQPTLHHKGVVVFRGGFSDNISNADPFYGNGIAYDRLKAKAVDSKPLDDEDESKLSADLINNFIRKSHEILDKHSLNDQRAKKGLFSANYLLCRDAGSDLGGFKKLRGKWMALGYTPLDKGIAKLAKMDLFNVTYPKMKNIDVYDNMHAGLKKSIKGAVKMLKKNRNRYDYFYIHFSELETAGKDNKPAEKVKMLELLDNRFFGFLNKFAEKNKARIVLTSSNVTSSRLKANTTGAVPVLFYDANNLQDNEKRFTEDESSKGRRIAGSKLLERTLFSRK